jgi:hypothetical protein
VPGAVAGRSKDILGALGQILSHPRGRIVMDAQGMENLAAYSRFAAPAIAAGVASASARRRGHVVRAYPSSPIAASKIHLLSTRPVVLAWRRAIAGNLEHPAWAALAATALRADGGATPMHDHPKRPAGS